MGIILIRYGELALKSRQVRLRFERTLMRNIEDLFLRENRECIISREWGRIMAHVGDDAAAGKILGRVFGITSFSPAIECPSEMRNVAELAARRSLALLRDGQSFAIRARRTGTHPYSSQQLAALAGSAVMEANRGRGIQVDLSSPDVEIFIEVRGKNAYIIADRFPGPGGLPMGTQGRVVVLLDGENGAAAAWMMMKRGCRVIAVAGEAGSRGTGEPVGEPGNRGTGEPVNRASGEPAGGPAKGALEMLWPWAPGLNLHVIEDTSMEGLARFAGRRRAEAIVLGRTYDELDRQIPGAAIPVLLPLCGLSDKEISALTGKIRGSGAPSP